MNFEDIANYIQRERKDGKSDEEISKSIKSEGLHFGNCSEIDCLYFGKKEAGGFWRSAYNYPNLGDTVMILGTHEETVTDCGFFTFSSSK